MCPVSSSQVVRDFLRTTNPMRTFGHSGYPKSAQSWRLYSTSIYHVSRKPIGGDPRMVSFTLHLPYKSTIHVGIRYTYTSPMGKKQPDPIRSYGIFTSFLPLKIQRRIPTFGSRRRDETQTVKNQQKSKRQVSGWVSTHLINGGIMGL